MKIKDSVALVTGSNRGIGKALIKALVEAGAKKIYASARSVTEINIEESATEIVPLQLDVSEHSQIQKIVSQADDVNLLFNNAGVLDYGDILNVELSHIKRNFDINFYGSLIVSRNFTPVIEKNGGGAIVNILTLLSLASMPGFAAYNASKAAAWSMTLSLRASLSDKNIDVHGVFPGAVDTDMLDGVEIPKTSPADVAQAILNAINNDQEDIFPDPMSIDVYGKWSKDHKSVEKQFALM